MYPRGLTLSPEWLYLWLGAEGLSSGDVQLPSYQVRGAMNVYMTMMRTGLFLQRERPGSELGNSLRCPDETSLRRRLGVDQCRASLSEGGCIVLYAV